MPQTCRLGQSFLLMLHISSPSLALVSHECEMARNAVVMSDNRSFRLRDLV